MSAAVLRTPTLEHPPPSFAPPSAHIDAISTTHGPMPSASDSSNKPSPTRPSSIPSSSYAVVSAPRTPVGFSNAPQLGSSHSESEPHFPGAWVDTAPGTPVPLKDNIDNLAQQVKNTGLTERAGEVLPTVVTQYLRTSLARLGRVDSTLCSFTYPILQRTAALGI
jgi:hypothetical protein